jgi:16S rRNA (guanine527-N7)-methyltransferase
VDALADRYGLAGTAASALLTLLELLASDPLAPTAIRDPQTIVDDHLADSLVALELPYTREAAAIADLGSGAGLPGLPLAIARPDAELTLLEANARKCAFIGRAAHACGIANATVVNARAEAWPDGIGRFDLVTARALAAPAIVAEYAAPLLALGGRCVIWRGSRDPAADDAMAAAGDELGLELAETRPVQPYPAVVGRSLDVMLKVRDTPSRFPRRPGVARKRPLGPASRTAGDV